jgi:YgiT-type zinc finger domain-containing protein
MKKNTRMHTCSLCGGDVIKKIDDLILKFPRHAAVLEKVEIGECTNCGERYYPAATSERLQERINELLDSRIITASDRKKIDIFSAQHAIVNNLETIDQLTQRVVALESSLKTLTTAEAHTH